MTGIRSYLSGMTLTLLIAFLLLSGLLYVQWHRPLSRVPAPDKALSAESEPPQREKTTNIQPFVPSPLSNFSQIAEHPLFVDGRLPPELPAEEKSGADLVAPPPLKLEGVAITSQSRTAVITDLRTNELLRLNEGMSHDDWTLESVGNESVTIKRGAQEMVLKFELKERDAPMRVTNPNPNSLYQDH